MPVTCVVINNLIQEHAGISSQMARIADLSEDIAILASIQDKSQEFTPYQYSFLNHRRINLRRSLTHFKANLKHHYQQEEKALQPLVGDPIKQYLEQQHSWMLQKLTETEELLLNLSPVGILFNGPYLKQKIDTLCQTINTLSSMEGKLLEIVEIYL
jgi:hypothetical protein